ncbi:hypothetical protein AB1L42_20485 [Thalassoglobus sp. JC818]|uniref:hypothetical protein n=1 Tax=Thalassoglobus sp. JC818 TaxID=3232136 RepID=UPI003459B044
MTTSKSTSGESSSRSSTAKDSARSTEELVTMLVEQAERRERRRERLKRKRRKDRRRAEHLAMVRMQRSVEVMKWCLVSISSVMAIGLIVGLVVLNSVRAEAERIKSEVQHIQREAEMIRDKIRHPLETLGGTLGRSLESRISESFQDE